MVRSLIGFSVIVLITVAFCGLLVFHWMIEIPLDIDAPTSTVGVACGKTRMRDERPRPFSQDHELQKNRELETKYTIRMNTFRRNDLLKRVLEHYRTCPKVHAIQVIWSDQDSPPPPLVSLLKKKTSSWKLRGNTEETPTHHRTRPKIEYEVHSLNSLNNRFRPIIPIATEAVFSIDDDLIIPCAQLDFAHTVWRSAPETMVGFMPRMHGFNEVAQRFTYHDWWYTWKHGLYSMVLTKACFLHKHLLYRYSGIEIPKQLRLVNNQPNSSTTAPPPLLTTNDLVPRSGILKTIHEYVDEHRNCEDIAMSFVAANISMKPSTWVRGAGVSPIGSSGLSSNQAAHYKARSDCMNVFASLFGGMPLITATHKVDHASNFLFWQ